MTTSIDDLEPLPLHRFRLDLELGADLDLPAERRGIAWRGAFGLTYRGLVCHDLRLACATCPLLTACPYPALFEPRVPADRVAPRRLGDPPRPFVLTDSSPESSRLARGPAALDLVLVGLAHRQLAYVLAALRRLGEVGIGPGRVRFRVLACRTLDAAGVGADEVFAEGSPSVRAPHRPLRARDLVLGDPVASRVRVTFRTATELVSGGESGVAAPAFGVLLRRARDRIGALATFYGEAPLAAAPRALAEAADSVRIVDSTVRETTVSRRSSRTGSRHPVGGIVGSVVYEGPALAEAMPWLRVVELVGVGKHATFGGGRIRVEVVG